MEQQEDVFAKIEAMLFAAGYPVPIEKMAQALELSYEEVALLINQYSDILEDSNRGVKIAQFDKCVQMVSKPCYHEYIANVTETRSPRNLSQSALEVLTIIAYNQPVTKAMIDEVRGVDSYNSICRLSERELIEQRGNLNTVGKPKLYGTTSEFLRMFGLDDLTQLPPIETDVIKNAISDNNMSFDELL